MARTAARRYAEAIVSLAKENNAFEVWDRDLKRLVDALGDDQTAHFLANPAVPITEKRNTLDVVLSGTQPETHNLVRILLERHRLPDIHDIYELFTEAWLKEQGIAIAYVTTAEPVTPDDERAIRSRLQQLTGQQIELRLKVDPDLIGGLIARVGDMLLDGSVQSKLRALRQRLSTLPA